MATSKFLVLGREGKAQPLLDLILPFKSHDSLWAEWDGALYVSGDSPLPPFLKGTKAASFCTFEVGEVEQLIGEGGGEKIICGKTTGAGRGLFFFPHGFIAHSVVGSSFFDRPTTH